MNSPLPIIQELVPMILRNPAATRNRRPQT
jgi:hypothetical protein